VESDAEPGVLAFTRKDLHLGGHGRCTVVERDALAQRSELLAGEVAVYLDVIGLRHVVAGREQASSQLAVIGQEQDAFGIEVESTDRLHGDRKVRKVVHHRRSPAVVADRGDAALGLVEQHVEVVERDDSFTVHLHGVAVGVDLGAEHSHDLVVHLHATCDDQLLCLAACGNPGSGEVPLQADRRAHGHSASGSSG
jgi:hypothetical protein